MEMRPINLEPGAKVLKMSVDQFRGTRATIPLIEDEWVAYKERCLFEDLCEKLYPEGPVADKRKSCTMEHCKKCEHYRNFYAGYHTMDEN